MKILGDERFRYSRDRKGVTTPNMRKFSTTNKENLTDDRPTAPEDGKNQLARDDSIVTESFVIVRHIKIYKSFGVFLSSIGLLARVV